MGGPVERGEGAEPRERLTEGQRRRVARRLAMTRGLDRHMAARLAEGYEVSARWLRALRRRLEAGEWAGPRGRPRTSPQERARVRGLVLEQLQIQGQVGWRAVLAGIRRSEAERARERPTSTMLVQQETAAIKRAACASKRRRLEGARVSYEVLYRDAVWAQDSLHAGRLPDRSEVSAEVATDRATTATVIAAVGPPLTDQALLGHLEGAKAARGGPPLVWQRDRGGANRSGIVAAYCEREQVIQLESRPHTPTDNAAAEHKNREVEEESGLGKGRRLTGLEEASQGLSRARRRLDEGRLRASRGWKTAAELDRALPRADAVIDRARFYADCRAAMCQAVLGLTDAAQISKAEQDAIWSTMARYGAVRVHHGRRATPCPRLPPAAPRKVG